MGWAESVSPNGMGRNRTGPIDIWAQMGRAQTGWAESGGHHSIPLPVDVVKRLPQHCMC